MPKISEFYGIVLRMYHDEHAPPHFHAEHAGLAVAVDFDGRVLHGRIHPRALRMVRQWARLHHRELEVNWARARNALSLVAIEPLE